jgi:3-oxoacyl-[acyl-carrier protein] reductase
MARNLRYVFSTCRATVNAMLEQGRGGAIVNIASLSAQRAASLHSGYGAAKAGVANLTMSLAAEYGAEGIRVNAISPGSILTPATAPVNPPERIAEYRTLVPLARIGQPDDIAGAALFLASDLAAYVTGQVLIVDGGASIAFPLPLPPAAP